MDGKRRTLLKAAALAGASLSSAGCEGIISRVARELGEDLPDRAGVASGPEVDPLFHLLSRTSFGVRPGDIDRARRLGAQGWIDEQLQPEGIDDGLCDLRARRFETLHHSPGTCFEYRKSVLREEITRHALLRAVYSRRQLFEVMVEFWTDHLNISLNKGDCIYLKPSDDRLVVRPHALGRFRDLIRASVTSPAMLEYLDGNGNGVRGPGDRPNENHARELLELHTLGVDGGYTQRDVLDTARCLTGWRMRERWRRGTVYFDPGLHDDGKKQVLGHAIPAGGGIGDVEKLVDIVCRHPSTARHIARKLSQRFVSEDPPESLVARAARLFRETDGDMRAVLRGILLSEEFDAARAAKIKRPFHFVAGCLRALGADTHARRPLLQWLERMGQPPFQHPSPDGYPDEAAPWLGTLLWRWNFAFTLVAGRLPGTRVPLRALHRALGTQDGRSPDPVRLLRHFLGRAGTSAEISALEALATTAVDGRDGAVLTGMILASPAFQRY